MSGPDAVFDTAAEREWPGKILFEARKAQGLTLAEVSNALKFSARQIDALENDDYQQLQGKTFLRGFVRAYARLLKLESDPLLRMLVEETTIAPEPIVAPANMGETDPVPFYLRHSRKIAFAFVLLLLAAGSAWYVRDRGLLERQAQPVEPAMPTARLGADVDGASNALPSATGPQQVPPAPTQAAQPPPALLFEFSDRSWLEVKDASGQLLLTGEFPSGEIKSVTGKPPYQIWIGKASAVKLTYGERVIDVQPYARDEIARFTVE